ncbi:MAG: cytochrome-c peroxidase [Thermoguttaceae bacterium]
MTKSQPLATVSLTTVALLLIVSTAANAAEKGVPQGPHGAATEKYQQQVLETWKLPTNLVDTAPRGVDPIYWNGIVPKDNISTPERVVLGKKLYFDPRLSKDGTVSCATCHDTTRGLSDQRPTSEGIDQQFGRRNSPTTMNVAFLSTMFWDGRSPSVEHQAMQPIVNPIEMGMPLDEATIIAPIKGDPTYVDLFKKAYGREVNYTDIGNAIAAFERTFIFLDSPFRRYLLGDENAVSEDAKIGWVLFNKEARCATCHPMTPSNPVGSDGKFHNIGIAAQNQNFATLAQHARTALKSDTSEAKLEELALDSDSAELGRFLVTKEESDIGAFRTPSLLNVGVTAPYMHNGSMATLWDVVDHYNKGGVTNRSLDGGIEPLNLSETQVRQLVEFLFALTDKRFDAQNQTVKTSQLREASQPKNRTHRDDAVALRKRLQFEPSTATATAPPTKKFENETQAAIEFVYPL